MLVEFDDPKLQKLMESAKDLRREFGADGAKKIQNRLTTLRAVRCVDDLRIVPGRWHPLSENWAEHWSGDLAHPLRLIVRPVKPVPRTDDGGVDWFAVIHVSVVAIHDTH